MHLISTKFINGSRLPFVIEPTNPEISFNETLQLLENENDFFKKNLLQYGGILFRNFPIKNEHDFSSFIKTLKTGSFVDYIGGDSPRKKVAEGIYTSTEAPPSFRIPLHNELSFVKNYPSHIYFYCNIAPKERGETPIADARKVYQSIDPEIRKRFIEKKLKYVSCYHGNTNSIIKSFNKSHKSWMDVFETNNKTEVETKCLSNEFEYQWNRNDWLQISQTRPATLIHPITKEEVWFNQAHLFDLNPRFLGWWNYLGVQTLYLFDHTKLHQIFFGDGTKIPQSDLNHIMDVLDANSIHYPWQSGDVLMLDNILAMHGRASFSGKRRVLAAMTSN